MKTLKLVIGVPSGQTWDAEFGMCLLFLSNYLVSHPIEGFKDVQMGIRNIKGSILPNMRQDIVADAIKEGASHVLFIDSDQTFPADVVHRLIAHRKQVVACNITTKGMYPNPTARKKGATKAGDLIFSNENSPKLEQVWRIGTGIMLIDLNLFKRPGAERPWFTPVWQEDLNQYSGEDWGFCDFLDRIGVKMWVDHRVSLEVGHRGMLTFTHDMVDDRDGTLSSKSA